MRELAENANAYTVLGPDEERVEDPRFVIWFGPGDHPAFTVVQRLRLSTGQLDEEVAEIRAAIAARGRRACTWEVAGSATPADLTDRLISIGLVPDRDPLAIGMVLTEPPQGTEPPGIVVRRAETLAEVEAAIRIAGIAFDLPADALEPELERAPTILADEGKRSATYLAFSEGRPVARATASFTPAAVLLFGGATLPEARGGGAYRALVKARWDDAVARSTPFLVTHAGALSRPILGRLGFREVAVIRILLDEHVSSRPPDSRLSSL